MLALGAGLAGFGGCPMGLEGGLDRLDRAEVRVERVPEGLGAAALGTRGDLLGLEGGPLGLTGVLPVLVDIPLGLAGDP